MSADRPTDPASPVPPAAPLTGEPAEPNQPDPSQVFPIGDASELDHLTDEDES